MHLDQYQELSGVTDLTNEQYMAVAEKFRERSNHLGETAFVIRELFKLVSIGEKLDTYKRSFFYNKELGIPAYGYVDAVDIVPKNFDAPVSQLMHGLIGAATEIAELADAVLAHICEGKELDTTNILEECGDVMWYLGRIADSSDSKLSTTATANIAKLRKRFGDKFSAHAALNRDTESERKVLENSISESK